jgi:hypothetical protein
MKSKQMKNDPMWDLAVRNLFPKQADEIESAWLDEVTEGAITAEIQRIGREVQEFWAGWCSATNGLGGVASWEDWSRSLSDSERVRIEEGGYDSGLREGVWFVQWSKANQ